ncbi:hypothetical protein [uncultured Brevundimonas sp.]|uniref:hypothetical protein n=1 Tax=uncultured Brevundimonas sp. TaxID=213418 RepID=UPI0030EBBC7A|tara:strand:+ start:114 stop:434 length:321 start_codon:yes stop_codon:yes gene_type:complete
MGPVPFFAAMIAGVVLVRLIAFRLIAPALATRGRRFRSQLKPQWVSLLDAITFGSMVAGGTVAIFFSGLLDRQLLWNDMVILGLILAAVSYCSGILWSVLSYHYND